MTTIGKTPDAPLSGRKTATNDGPGAALLSEEDLLREVAQLTERINHAGNALGLDVTNWVPEVPKDADARASVLAELEYVARFLEAALAGESWALLKFERTIEMVRARGGQEVK